jgi:exonuclease SbcD
MKIIHTSDIGLGKKFTGLKVAGDKLRAGLKTALQKIIDYTIKEKADLLIIAGNLFNNLEISKNLQDFVASELGRLDSIQAVIVPGIRDKYADGSFWKTWQTLRDFKNVTAIINPQKPCKVFDNLDLAVYAIFNSAMHSAVDDGPVKPDGQKANYHIGVTCTPMDSTSTQIGAGLKLDYLALGGEKTFTNLSSGGMNAAYCGSPEKLDFNHEGNGGLAVIEIDSQKQLKIRHVPIGSFIWRKEEIKAKDILNNDELMQRIRALAAPDSLNTALRVNLTGLALFEADLSPSLVEQHLEDEFLYLEIIDNMKVLPENVSEVKVSEKTLLGQYIKVMASDISDADEALKSRLEKSAKVGLALLQGKEIW